MSARPEVPEAEELWALPVEEFTAARDALAKRLRSAGRAADAAAVNALRKPTRDAWVVNRLAALEPQALAALVEVGERLRAAQVQRRADELRALASERDQALEAALHTAGRVAGALTPAVREAVRATFVAALSDPEAADQVRAGRLSSGLSYAGLGAAPLSAVPTTSRGATAAPTSAPAPVSPAKREAARARLHEAEEQLTAAQLARADAQAQVDELEAELAESKAALRDAEREVRAASGARDQAARAVARLHGERP